MGEISVKTGNNARNGGKNSLNRLIRCVCGKKIGPDPRNFNQRVSLGRNDLLIRTFPSTISHLTMAKARRTTWIFRVFICFAQSQQLMQN
ncbi:fimbrial biogenesis outer membrane usher domain protein [Escherichia coli 1-182-04_S3_C3]|nr:fimbrial biogenesis outer membrane usher domain protein [Escherichia coli 1-182-04_S3_C3]EZJ90849.1 fimbrial biogenesis outer membrane usher domain protein [Escherichia coli 1-182-04_S3_C1]